jgi:hypothetical protein
MNEVSIIINGVRYDAVDMGSSVGCSDNCDLASQCLWGSCSELLESTQVFKKSDKKY